MLRTQLAFRAAELGGIDITFHISTGAVASLVIIVELFLAQLDIDSDMDAAIGGHFDGALTELLEEEVGIVGIDVAILVKVGVFLVIDFRANAGDIVQKRLAVRRRDLAVAVEIAVFHFGGIRNFNRFAVHNPAHVCSKHGSPGVFKDDDAAVVKLVRKQILRKEVSAQRESCGRVFHVIEGETEGVFAGAVGIVAQFGLNLTVRIGGGGVLIHQQIAAAGNRRANVCKAGALPQNRIVARAVFAIVLDDRRSRGHQQTLRQHAVRQAGFFGKSVLLDVLRKYRRHACNLRGGHGGTGHILVAAAVHQGVDVAAGCGDLGLHLQRTGNAPAGEVAHGIVIAVKLTGIGFGKDGHLAGVVQDIAGAIGDSLRIFLDVLAV